MSLGKIFVRTITPQNLIDFANYQTSSENWYITNQSEGIYIPYDPASQIVYTTLQDALDGYLRHAWTDNGDQTMAVAVAYYLSPNDARWAPLRGPDGNFRYIADMGGNEFMDFAVHFLLPVALSVGGSLLTDAGGSLVSSDYTGDLPLATDPAGSSIYNASNPTVNTIGDRPDFYDGVGDPNPQPLPDQHVLPDTNVVKPFNAFDPSTWNTPSLPNLTPTDIAKGAAAAARLLVSAGTPTGVNPYNRYVNNPNLPTGNESGLNAMVLPALFASIAFIVISSRKG